MKALNWFLLFAPLGIGLKFLAPAASGLLSVRERLRRRPRRFAWKMLYAPWGFTDQPRSDDVRF